MQNDNLESNVKNCPSRKGFLIVTIIAVLAIVFGAIVTFRLVKTKEAYQQANDQKLINESKELARESLEVLKTGDTKLAAQLALAGMPDGKKDRPFVPESVNALYQVMNPYDMGVNYVHDFALEHDANVAYHAESLDGKNAISVDEDGNVYIWDLTTGKCLDKEMAQYNNGFAIKIADVGFSGDKAIVITEKKIIAYSFDGKVLYDVPIEDGIDGGKVDRFGKYIAAITNHYDDNQDIHTKVTFVDASSGNIINEYENLVDARYDIPIAFSEDGNYAAVAHFGYTTYPVEELPNYVSVFNMNSDEHVDIPVKEGRVLNCVFTKDGGLAVNSVDDKEVNASKITALYLEKFDVASGSKIWEKSYQYASSTADPSILHMRSAYFEGDDREVIAMVGTGKVYVVDSNSGEDITTLIAPNCINRVGAGDTQILVATVDGYIYYYDYVTGELKTKKPIRVAKNLRDVSICEGVLVARDKDSHNLTVMSLHDDNDCLSEVRTDKELTMYAASSPSGKTYAVVTHSSDTSDFTYEIVIFDTKTGEKKGSFVEESIDSKNVFYIDENTIVVINNECELLYYSTNGEKLDSYKVSDSYMGYSYGLSTNHKYAIFSAGDNYYIVDIAKKKSIHKGAIDSSISKYSISDDGTIICYTRRDQSCWLIDCKNESSESFLNNYKIKQAIVSPNGKTIAAVCTDGYLRVVDASNEDIIDEIKYDGKSDSFLELSEDGKQVYFQDSNKYFYIYDVQDKELKYISENQLFEVEDILLDDKKDMLVLCGFAGIQFVDLNNYGTLNYSRYGELYLPQQEIVICVNGNLIKEFKYISADELIKEANKKYGKDKLTEAQKLKYKVN